MVNLCCHLSCGHLLSCSYMLIYICRFIGLDLLATINWEAHQHVHHGNLMHP